MKRENELAIWIILSTWCRAGETMKAEWKDVRLQKAEWFLPAANTKTKVSRLVHLSPFALRQFEDLHLLTGHTPWCFPARPNGRMRESAKPPDRHMHEKSASKQVGDRQVRFMSRGVRSTTVSMTIRWCWPAASEASGRFTISAAPAAC